MMPDELVGAWQRVSIALGDAPPSEPANVVWLQGWSAYADIRVPRDGAADGFDCFAGHTMWEPPCLRWRHDIDDKRGRDALDVGHVEWVDGDLVETGVVVIDGAEVPYVEVWRKAPAGGTRVVEITDAGFTHVEIGHHALTVVNRSGAVEACYRRDGAVVLAIGGRT